MKQIKAMHALTLASARHLLNQGHISRQKHAKIAKGAKAGLRMSSQQAPMPAEEMPEQDFGALMPMGMGKDSEMGE